MARTTNTFKRTHCLCTFFSMNHSTLSCLSLQYSPDCISCLSNSLFSSQNLNQSTRAFLPSSFTFSPHHQSIFACFLYPFLPTPLQWRTFLLYSFIPAFGWPSHPPSHQWNWYATPSLTRQTSIAKFLVCLYKNISYSCWHKIAYAALLRRLCTRTMSQNFPARLPSTCPCALLITTVRICSRNFI